VWIIWLSLVAVAVGQKAAVAVLVVLEPEQDCP
jgi:hypothetical protein